MADSQVTLVGNVTRAPELKYTAGGRGVSSFGIAVNRRWMNKTTGDWDEQVSFFNVTAWGELGENIAASLEKGNRAIVIGRLEQRKYTDREGNEKSVVECVADSIGPDLRWATCEIHRAERTQSNDQAPPRANQSAPAITDEEPF
jgi:single-strand DNA-binding protein